MVSEDYATRAIRDMVRALGKMVLNEELIRYELPEEAEDSAEDALYRKLLILADAGEINEAENLLSEELDPENPEHFRLAMAFYLHLNEMAEYFLDTMTTARKRLRTGPGAWEKTSVTGTILNCFFNGRSGDKEE